MDEDGLVLTNYSRVLDIGRNYSCRRYQTARSFLDNNQDNIDLSKLVGLLRNEEISCVGSPYTESRNSAIFVPETLDPWIAVDPPPANRGRWVGFNLKKELNGSGHLLCPKCLGSMRIISFIEDDQLVKKILKHLSLWDVKRKPLPRANDPPSEAFIIYDQSSSPSADDYIIDADYPIESYL
jgi:hypothetical protein